MPSGWWILAHAPRRVTESSRTTTAQERSRPRVRTPRAESRIVHTPTNKSHNITPPVGHPAGSPGVVLDHVQTHAAAASGAPTETTVYPCGCCVPRLAPKRRMPLCLHEILHLAGAASAALHARASASRAMTLRGRVKQIEIATPAGIGHDPHGEGEHGDHSAVAVTCCDGRRCYTHCVSHAPGHP